MKVKADRKTEYSKILSAQKPLLDAFETTYDRLCEPARTDLKKDVMKLTVSAVFAPTLNAFVIDTLHKAIKEGIEELYFLARDAYFMYLCACEYVEKYNLPIKCKYLYVSRYSLRVPLFHRDIDKATDVLSFPMLDFPKPGDFSLVEENTKLSYCVLNRINHFKICK